MKYNIQVRRTQSGAVTASFRYDPVVARAMRSLGMEWNATGKIWWTKDRAVEDRLREFVRTGVVPVVASVASHPQADPPWWADAD